MDYMNTYSQSVQKREWYFYQRGMACCVACITAIVDHTKISLLTLTSNLMNCKSENQEVCTEKRSDA